MPGEVGSLAGPQRKHKKPLRNCLCCDIPQIKCTRHLKLKHSEDKRVARALKLPKRERDMVFSQLKKEGIYKQNKREMKSKDPNYERERKPKTKGELVICGLCNGFYAKKFFIQHKERCRGDASSVPVSLPVSLLNLDSTIDKHFWD